MILVPRILANGGELMLALAHYEPGARYDREAYSAAYMARSYRLYRPGHLQRAAAMALKAAGLTPNGRMNDWLTRGGYRFLRYRLTRLERVAA